MNEKLSRSARRKAAGRLSILEAAALIALPIVAGFICLGIGRMSLTPADVFRALIVGADVPKLVYVTIVNTRLPRILLALLCGAGLSVAGCAFQSLFANPLATPDTLGVASGAGFGAALGIMLGLKLVGIQLTSMMMGCAAIALTRLASAGKDRSMNTVVLSGIMMSSLFSALISLLKYAADTEAQLPAITYWLMGSLDGAGYRTLLLGAPPILVSIVLLFLLRWRMNILPLSEDEAKASGTNLAALRIVTVLCATLITASCVSMCGQIGWVGLLVPHICRMKFGTDHSVLIPASVSVGAAFVVVVDTVARSATAAEIPISVLTAIIGAPFFILLVRRTGGWRF